VPDYPVKLIRQKKFHSNISVLVGSNTDEGTFFIFTGYPVYLFEETGRAILEHSVPAEFLPRLNDHYPSTLPIRTLLNRVYSDVFTCSVRRFAAALFKGGAKGVYLYHYAHQSRGLSWPFNALGIMHGGELAYVFHHTARMAPEEIEFSTFLMGLWGQFVRGEVDSEMHSHQAGSKVHLRDAEHLEHQSAAGTHAHWHSNRRAWPVYRLQQEREADEAEMREEEARRSSSTPDEHAGLGSFLLLNLTTIQQPLRGFAHKKRAAVKVATDKSGGDAPSDDDNDVGESVAFLSDHGHYYHESPHDVCDLLDEVSHHASGDRDHPLIVPPRHFVESYRSWFVNWILPKAAATIVRYRWYVGGALGLWLIRVLLRRCSGSATKKRTHKTD